MTTRTVYVKVVGDSRSAERMFQRVRKEAQATDKELVKFGARRSKGIGPFRVAGIGMGAGLGLFAGTQVVRELGDRIKATGAEAFTAEGKLRNMASALSSGNIVGAFDALRATRKTIEDFGITIEDVALREKELKAATRGIPEELQKQQSSAQALGYTSIELGAAQDKMAASMKAAGVQTQDEAKILLKSLDAYKAAIALAEELARVGQYSATHAGPVVRFLGPRDMRRAQDEGRTGTGARATTGATFRPGLTPSERRELALTGQQGAARLPGLEERLRQLKNMQKVALTNEELLRVSTNAKNTEAEIAGIMADIAAARKAAAIAAAAAAEAARQQRLAAELGWLELAAERAEETKPIKDDLKRLRDIENYWRRRIRSEGLKLALVEGLYRTQRRIRNLSKGQDGDPLAGLMQASTKQLTSMLAAGTGLNAAGRRTLGANISGAQIQTFVNVSLDGQQVAKSVTVNQKRSGNRTGAQTSGRRG